MRRMGEAAVKQFIVVFLLSILMVGMAIAKGGVTANVYDDKTVPFDKRTLPPASLYSIPEMIEFKHQQMIDEKDMPIERLALEMAVAHKAIRKHEKEHCGSIPGVHFHEYTVYDLDRLADLIVEKYCAR